MDYLRKLRKENNLTMKQLAQMVGVAEGTISLYETGKRFPGPETLCALADALDVSLDYLVRGKEKDRPKGRSKEELLKMYDEMSEEELAFLSALIQAALADKRFQAHLRQGSQE